VQLLFHNASSSLASVPSALDHCIQERFERFSKLLFPLLPKKFEVIVHYESFEKTNPKALSMFDAAESGLSHFVFKFDFFRLQNLKEDDSKLFAETLDRCVLHELVHALDISVIQESCRVYHSGAHELQQLNHHPGIYWSVMHYFFFLRNEAVALLAEELFLGSNENLAEKLNEFEHALTKLLNNVCNSHVESSEALKEACEGAYSYAAHVALFLSNDKNSKALLTQENKLKLLESFLQLDLSEWIASLFVKFDFLKNFDNGALNVLFDLGENEDNWRILTGKYLATEYELISHCESVLSERLSLDQLEKALAQDRDSVHDLELEVLERARKLFSYRSEFNAHFVDWILSYIFAKDDLIDDDRPFVGYVDDSFLLDVAFCRMNSFESIT
jgi:hypothetical protein